jgi:hypothetical protein
MKRTDTILSVGTLSATRWSSTSCIVCAGGPPPNLHGRRVSMAAKTFLGINDRSGPVPQFDEEG